MQFIKHTNPRILIADEGKQIRDINDVERTEIDDEGNENKIMPYYSSFVFIADGMTEQEVYELYVEE